MKILAIETSCDDTCVAIVEAKPRRGSKIPDFKILANVISSQIKIHRKYGGVVPSLAKRAHQENLPLVLGKALRKSGNAKIDLIAVTYGPGLEPALWTGINFAKELSREWKVPLLGVDHMRGHIAANFLEEKSIKFPAICLAVSGGHTQLILVKGIFTYKLLGETLDDAAGEAFDKVARLLGLNFPGGPEIQKQANKFSPDIRNTRLQSANSSAVRADSFGGQALYEIRLPRPMLHTKDYNFSFSGLKTAVLYDYKKRSPEIQRSREYIQEMSYQFQQAVVDVLIAKTISAAKEYKAKTIMLAGGVAANTELRKQLGGKIKQFVKSGELKAISYKLPASKLATDNAAMIAAAAYFRRNQATLTRWKTLEADGNLKIGQK